MPSRRIYAEIAIDESSQFKLSSRNPLVTGCVLLFDGMRKRAKRNVRKNLPKWRDASPQDVEHVLSFLEDPRTHGKVTILEGEAASADLLRARMEGFFSDSQDKVEAAIGKPAPARPSIDGYLRLLAFGTVESTLATAAFSETAARDIRRDHVATIQVQATLYVDKYSSRPHEAAILKRAITTWARTRRLPSHGDRPRIIFDIKEVLLVEEHTQATLLLVDYLCGLTAAVTNPHYTLKPALQDAPLQDWYARLRANPNILVKNTRLETFLSAFNPS